MIAFEVGDVVELKSSTTGAEPKLTIDHFTDDGRAGCIYWAGTEYSYRIFGLQSLRLAPASNS